MSMIIGLVGEIRGGKGVFVELVKKTIEADGKTMVCTRFSDILYETLQAWGIECSRENLQKMAQAMNEKFGDGTLTRAVEQRLGAIDADVVVLDGVRWIADEEFIRKFEHNAMMYVTADVNIRHQRALQSQEKAGEDSVTLEEFQEAEKAPNEIYISSIGARADWCIVNNGGLDTVTIEVQAFYDEIVKHHTGPLA